MATTVSRRVVTIKMKNRPRRAKLQREAEPEAGTRRTATPTTFVPHVLPLEQPWWRDLLRPLPLTTLIGIVAGIGILIWSAGRPHLSGNAAKATDRPAAVVGGGPGVARTTRTLGTDGREQPTAESFLATGFIRRKATADEPAPAAAKTRPDVVDAAAADRVKITLPSDASGKCAITGNGAHDLLDCFRKHGGR